MSTLGVKLHPLANKLLLCIMCCAWTRTSNSYMAIHQKVSNSFNRIAAYTYNVYYKLLKLCKLCFFANLRGQKYFNKIDQIRYNARCRYNILKVNFEKFYKITTFYLLLTLTFKQF